MHFRRYLGGSKNVKPGIIGVFFETALFQQCNHRMTANIRLRI